MMPCVLILVLLAHTTINAATNANTTSVHGEFDTPTALVQGHVIVHHQVQKTQPSQQQVSSFNISVQHKMSARKMMNIDIYVINLEKRGERCKCMQWLLADVPYNVYRQNASVGPTCGLKVGKQEDRRSKRDFNGQQGLFCSNYLVWEIAQHRQADFIVILEDDVSVQNGFWERLEVLLTSCDVADYLVVDSWGGEKSKLSPRTCKLGPQKQKRKEVLYDLRVARAFGTHMQVIRTSFLSKLIDLAKQAGSGSMDWWNWQHIPQRGRSFLWKPSMVRQASFKLQRGIWKKSVGDNCLFNITKSDIAMQLNLNAVAASTRTNTTSTHRLDCPA